jgi:hypothetical protein
MSWMLRAHMKWFDEKATAGFDEPDVDTFFLYKSILPEVYTHAETAFVIKWETPYHFTGVATILKAVRNRLMRRRLLWEAVALLDALTNTIAPIFEQQAEDRRNRRSQEVFQWDMDAFGSAAGMCCREIARPWEWQRPTPWPSAEAATPQAYRQITWAMRKVRSRAARGIAGTGPATAPRDEKRGKGSSRRRADHGPPEAPSGRRGGHGPPWGGGEPPPDPADGTTPPREKRPRVDRARGSEAEPDGDQRSAAPASWPEAQSWGWQAGSGSDQWAPSSPAWRSQPAIGAARQAGHERATWSRDSPDSPAWPHQPPGAPSGQGGWGSSAGNGVGSEPRAQSRHGAWADWGGTPWASPAARPSGQQAPGARFPLGGGASEGGENWAHW